MPAPKGQRLSSMVSARAAFALAVAAVVVMGGATPSGAAARPLPPPKILSASAPAPDAVTVSFSTVAGASSYTLFVYGASGRSAQPHPGALPGGTTVSGLAPCTTYRVAVQAISSSGNFESSVQSGKVSVTTLCAALVPTFGTPAPTSDGFTVQITNYDNAFNWMGSVTAGSATIDESGLATVTGLTTDASATLTVTTSRAMYASGSATVAGARITTQLTPSHWIGSGDFTAEMWVKPTVNWAVAGRQELFALTPSSLQGRLDITYEGTWAVLAHLWNDGDVPPVSAPMAPPPVDQWTHVALTRQSGIMRLYVAGQKVAESSASAGFSTYNELILGADVNASWCHCNLARALLSNVRVIDGTALYTGTTLAQPTNPLAAVAGTTFLLNNALGSASVGSVGLDGTMRYQQGISTAEGAPVISAFTGYKWDGNSWQTVPVVTSADSPFTP